MSTSIRLQVADPGARFACGSCTACCDQPWRTWIEPDKARALDAHDFSRHPGLAGRPFYDAGMTDALGRFLLSKGEGTRCLFLDHDGLCIIHKELGAHAKPDMCRQFPYLPSRNWTEDRVSVNYGCPSVQAGRGPALTEQADEIAELTPLSQRPPRPDAETMLDLRLNLTRTETDAVFDYAVSLFDESGREDVWTAFGELIALLGQVRRLKSGAADDGLDVNGLLGQARAESPLNSPTRSPAVQPFPTQAAAPLPVRMLFAATLFPDAVPADAADGLGLFRRLTMIPKLLTLAKLSGGYASRLLGRNVSVAAALSHPIEDGLAPDAAALLRRYFRSRLWQRMLAGTRLPVIGGIHQHIHDLNAIVFLARAEAADANRARLDAGLVRQALTRVEFHLANQPRLFDQTLRGWFRAQLCDVGLAMQSLRLMAPARCIDAATVD